MNDIDVRYTQLPSARGILIIWESYFCDAIYMGAIKLGGGVGNFSSAIINKVVKRNNTAIKLLNLFVRKSIENLLLN